jgi:hypothetical protein
MLNLRNVYAAATAKFGADLPLALARSFGAIHSVDDVPEARRDGLTAALNRILHGEGHISMTLAKAAAHGDAPRRNAVADQEDVFGAIRAKAYGTRNDDDDNNVKPAAKIDPVEIYARWNASRRPNEDE